MHPMQHPWPCGLLAATTIGLAAAHAPAVEPIYVSIVMHNEEPNPPMFPDYIGDAAVFWQSRNLLVAFADMLYANGVMFNWQSDWNFLIAVNLYDTGTPATNGKNVVRYLSEDLGFEVDPHAHATTYNQADVAFLIGTTGVPPSHTVGGMVVFPPGDSILEDLWAPIVGWMFPKYTWQAEILWGGGTALHVDEECLWSSGVWKPKDNDNFLVHDEAAPLPNVGKWSSTWEGLDGLIDRQSSGELVDGLMYTCSITVGQIQLDPAFIEGFESDLQNAADAGDIVWLGLSEVIDVWETSYASVANVLRLRMFGDWDNDGDVDGADFTSFPGCMTGPDPPGGIPNSACCVFDHGPDDDVDCDDWTQFRAAWTGPGPPPVLPVCDCPKADFDGDGTVGILDFLALLAAWGPCPGCAEDIDGDGVVGILDFLALLSLWGACP